MKKDVRGVGVSEEDAEERIRLGQMIHCSDHHRVQPKGKEEEGEEGATISIVAIVLS